MTINVVSKKGKRKVQLDRAWTVERNGTHILAVIDALGDLESSADFLDEFIYNLKLNVDIIFTSDVGQLDLNVGKFIETAALCCKNNGKVCIAIAVITKHDLVIGHSGDCRVYIPGRDFITNDHSVAFELSPDDIKHDHLSRHPLRNLILKTIAKNIQDYSVQRLPPLKLNEKLILCSDGLWRNISYEDIEKISLEKLDELLAGVVNSPIIENDNATVIYFINN